MADNHNLQADLDAIRVFVKALAESAEQQRLTPIVQEHLEEHLHAMESNGRSDDEIAAFMESFEKLKNSY